MMEEETSAVVETDGFPAEYVQFVFVIECVDPAPSTTYVYDVISPGGGVRRTRSLESCL